MIEDQEVSNHLARLMIGYNRRVFAARSVGLLDGRFDPPIVGELVNYLFWKDGFGDLFDIVSHSNGLKGIIDQASVDIERLQKEYGEAETEEERDRISLIADKYTTEAECAVNLLGVMTDGRD